MDSANSPPPPPPLTDEPDQAPAPAGSGSGSTVVSRAEYDKVPIAAPAELSHNATVGQATSTPGTVIAGGSSNSVEDFDPSPPQRRRTSSFEYNEDGPSQYDSLELVPKTPLSPLFLELIRAKIREAERQFHFASVSKLSNDRPDALKRYSCAQAELEYASQRVYLPPPIRFLEVKIQKATAFASVHNAAGFDMVTVMKKSEVMIQRALQVLGELVDWEEVKRRGSAVEMLEEFLPMCYFEDSKLGKSEQMGGGGAEEPGKLDYTEVMTLWYEMMIGHGRFTLTKAESKELESFKKVKVENYAKAAKLFLVGLQGLSEIYENEAEDDYAEYKEISTQCMERIALKMVENGFEDEFLEIITSTTPKLNVTELQTLILKAKQKLLETKENMRKNQEAGLKPDPEQQSKENAIFDIRDNTIKDKSKGKGKAVESYDDADAPPAFSSLKVDKGKGKAAESMPFTNGPPSYFDDEISRPSGAVEEKDDSDGWVIIPGTPSPKAESRS